LVTTSEILSSFPPDFRGRPSGPPFPPITNDDPAFDQRFFLDFFLLSYPHRTAETWLFFFPQESTPRSLCVWAASFFDGCFSISARSRIDGVHKILLFFFLVEPFFSFPFSISIGLVFFFFVFFSPLLVADPACDSPRRWPECLSFPLPYGFFSLWPVFLNFFAPKYLFFPFFPTATASPNSFFPFLTPARTGFFLP